MTDFTHAKAKHIVLYILGQMHIGPANKMRYQGLLYFLFACWFQMVKRWRAYNFTVEVSLSRMPRIP